MIVRLTVKTVTALTTPNKPWPKVRVLMIKMNIVAQVLVIFWIIIKIIMAATMWCFMPHLIVVAVQKTLQLVGILLLRVKNVFQ